jgi:hypothetical protein
VSKHVLLAALVLCGCSDGQKNPVGAEAPFRLRNAEFFAGTLPGSAPLPAGTPFSDDDPARLVVVSLASIVTQGQAGRGISGNATTKTWSIGMNLQGIGSGWWAIPAGDLDGTMVPPNLSFGAKADFGLDLPVGPATLELVAIDQQGVAGPHTEFPFCIASSGPDGVSVCPAAKVQVPAAAITLSWDVNADLDLQVTTPDGKLVTPKDPYVVDDEAGDMTKPHIDRDSNPNCVLDGARRESLIWPTPKTGSAEPPSGVYGIHVNLFSACGQQAVHFKVQVTTAVPADTGSAGASDDSESIEKVRFERSGELVPVQTNPTESAGSFVTEYDFGQQENEP